MTCENLTSFNYELTGRIFVKTENKKLKLLQTGEINIIKTFSQPVFSIVIIDFINSS